MAILDRFKVFICVDGQPLPEYDGPSAIRFNDDGALRTCHKFVQVPDVSGKDYYIRFEQTLPPQADRPVGESVLLRVSVDGKKRQGHTVTHRAVLDAEVLGTFARVEPTEGADQATVERDRTAAKSLGLIQVCVSRAVQDDNASFFTRASPVASEPLFHPSADGSFSIAERAIKGREVSFGTIFPPVPDYIVRYYERLGPPLAYFAFTYQSREALQRSGIISRDRVEEPQELLDRTVPLVKQEEQPPRLSVKRPREAFDLTGDGVVPMEVPAAYRFSKRQAVVNLDGDGYGYGDPGVSTHNESQ